jgi:hypothetical protein
VQTISSSSVLRSRVQAALAILALGVLSLGGGPASASVPEKAVAKDAARALGLSLGEELGAGQNQRAYLVEPRGGGKARVLKVFLFAPGARSDDTVRRDLAHIVEKTADLLRHDGKFVERFGRIIPRTEFAADGVTVSDFADGGVPLSALSPALREIAKREAEKARDMAKHVLGGLRCSTNLRNLLFDKRTGKITDWFDHLSHHDLERHLKVARRNGFQH